jgi:kynurenine 3-monooxygenase
MKQQRNNHVIVVGAGLAGSLVTVYLAQQGFKVSVYERRPDMRKANISAGKSINLALSKRGIHALQEVGLLDEIMQYAIPMRGRMMHAVDRELSFQQYGKDEHEVIYSISRGDLNKSLMNRAESFEGVELYFNSRCEDVDQENGTITVRNEETGEVEVHKADAIMGSDGAFSAVRSHYFHETRFNYSQYHLEHGYKELTIPPGPAGEFLIEKNALHIWPRHSYMLIALPNSDASFTCTLFFPFKGTPSFDSLHDEKQVRTFFREQFVDALELMPDLEEDFFSNPTGSLVTVRCNPWHLGGNVLLLGDASHAIVPFFGQGMNAAFEDCTVLNGCINEYGDDWAAIFPMMTRLRKENTDAIADMAIENFIEMRDKTADGDFLLRKKLEQALEERFPLRFIPKYSMVTFRRIPYSIAQKRGAIQSSILNELMENIDSLDDVNWTKAEMLINNRLEEIAL